MILMEYVMIWIWCF